jgi:hypothetical protein
MNFDICMMVQYDQYRGSEFSSEGFGAPEKTDASMVSQLPSVSVIDERGQREAQTAHDELMESFMEQVKAFIRNIDVSRL